MARWHVHEQSFNITRCDRFQVLCYRVEVPTFYKRRGWLHDRPGQAHELFEVESSLVGVQFFKW